MISSCSSCGVRYNVGSLSTSHSLWNYVIPGICVVQHITDHVPKSFTAFLSSLWTASGINAQSPADIREASSPDVSKWILSATE
jgi:hypothetical protein